MLTHIFRTSFWATKEYRNHRGNKSDLFETPVTVTPQQEISKTLNSSKIPQKILNIYFWGTSVYFWGTSVYFWGTSVHFWGIIGVFGIFGISFFGAGGFWDSVGRGGP